MRRVALLLPVLVLPALVMAVVLQGGAAHGDAVGVPPSRLLDTREGRGAPVGRLLPGTTLTLTVSAAVAAGATAVTVNLTATEALAGGYVTAWPCGQPQPATSILNVTPGRVVANLAMVGLGNGAICLASSVPVHLVADLMGWFLGTTDYRGAAPTRLVDTRTPANRLKAGEERRVSVAGGAGRTAGSRAVALNVTVVDPDADGFVTVYPCGPRPLASTVNFKAGEITPNFTLVPFTGTEVCVYSLVATDLVVDSFGWSDGSAGLTVTSPARVLDTRSGNGWTGGAAGPAANVELRVAGRGGVPLDAGGVLLTVTATGGTADGYVTVWPCDQPRPLASILNLRAGLLRSNLAFVPLSAASGSVCLWANTVNGSTVHLVADVVGWSPGGPSRTPPSDPGPGGPGGGMPLLSRSLPAFASSSAGGSGPDNAHDASNSSTWTSTAIPAWLAYDLSSVPVAQRQQSLVAIYAERANDYDNTGTVADWQQMPVDYTIETNTAPGGGNPPTAGWTPVVTVTGNVLAAPHHLVQLGGANWVRVRVTRAGGPSTVSLDVDVYAAPNGATDDWLFMGDSITSITFQRLFEDVSVAQRVNTRSAARWPGQIGAGIGGTNTNTAIGIIDARLASFPGKFVVLAYGTNDHPGSFAMEALVQKVIAAGKTPVVPHVPWSDTNVADLQQMNVMIDALYVKYPQILRGPDLYGLTLNRTDYIPSGDVHPTEAGRTAFLAAYAAIM